MKFICTRLIIQTNINKMKQILENKTNSLTVFSSLGFEEVVLDGRKITVH